MNISTVNT